MNIINCFNCQGNLYAGNDGLSLAHATLLNLGHSVTILCQNCNSLTERTPKGKSKQKDSVKGDFVQGDKVGGDVITLGNIGSGSSVAMGRGASVNGRGENPLARKMFHRLALFELTLPNWQRLVDHAKLNQFKNQATREYYDFVLLTNTDLRHLYEQTVTQCFSDVINYLVNSSKFDSVIEFFLEVLEELK